MLILSLCIFILKGQYIEPSGSRTYIDTVINLPSGLETDFQMKSSTDAFTTISNYLGSDFRFMFLVV